MALNLGFNQPIRLREFRVTLDRLPAAAEPLRVLLFSDIHLNGRPHHENMLLKLLRDTPADLVVFLGDALYDYDGNGAVALKFFTRLRRLIRPRFGLHLVRGNHDNRVAVRTLLDAGFSILLNSNIPMPGGSQPWYLVGVDDPRWKHDDLSAALSGVPHDAFKLLLAHSPDILPEADRFGIDLALAGHTHGGQIRLPWVGALVTRTKISQRYAWGLQTYGGTTIYTTCGAGSSFPPIRLNCPQEVVLLELVHG